MVVQSLLLIDVLSYEFCRLQRCRAHNLVFMQLQFLFNLVQFLADALVRDDRSKHLKVVHDQTEDILALFHETTPHYLFANNAHCDNPEHVVE